MTGIIGVPGDRDDSVIEQAGRVAGLGFHRVIIKEDYDLRGREKGEVAKLLCQAVKDESPETECQIVLDEITAMRSEIERLQDGQVIILFYDELEPVTKLLEDVGAIPVSTIDESVVVAEAQRAHIYSAISTWRPKVKPVKCYPLASVGFIGDVLFGDIRKASRTI